MALTNLVILNRGKEPTFATAVRKEVLDMSFASRSFLGRISNWRVSKEETASEHREINFEILNAKEEVKIFKNRKEQIGMFSILI